MPTQDILQSPLPDRFVDVHHLDAEDIALSSLAIRLYSRQIEIVQAIPPPSSDLAPPKRFVEAEQDRLGWHLAGPVSLTSSRILI